MDRCIRVYVLVQVFLCLWRYVCMHYVCVQTMHIRICTYMCMCDCRSGYENRSWTLLIYICTVLLKNHSKALKHVFFWPVTN